MLVLRQSWLGREDATLTTTLLAELPGILSWSLVGLDRLTAHDRFTEPAASTDAIVALQDLVSPVAAFVRDSCMVGEYEIPCEDLYQAWRRWADDNGHRPSTAQTFGRDLRAVVPGVTTRRPRDTESRRRWYRGIGLATTHNDPDRGPPRPRDVVLDGPRSGAMSVEVPSQSTQPTNTHDPDLDEDSTAWFARNLAALDLADPDHGLRVAQLRAEEVHRRRAQSR